MRRNTNNAANTDTIIIASHSLKGFVNVNGYIADAVTRKPLSGARITYKNATAAHYRQPG